MAASAFDVDANSLTGLGTDAVVDGGVKASRAMRTSCIANIVIVSSMYLWMTTGGNKERT